MVKKNSFQPLDLDGSLRELYQSPGKHHI